MPNPAVAESMMSDPANRLTNPAPSLAELRERLARGERIAEPEPVGEAYMPHAELEAKLYATYDRVTPTTCPGMLRVDDKGPRVWVMVCDECGEAVGVNVANIDPQLLLPTRMRHAGIPAEFAGKPFERDDPGQDDALEACKRWLAKFDAEDISASVPAIALWGDVGRGKSHLLSVMIETVVRRHNVPGMYRSAVALFDELQEGLGNNDYGPRWDRALTVPVLALDDLGAGRMTDWRRDRLGELVDRRYSRRLPLLIGTNIIPDRWPDVFGDRAASRLKGICKRVELRGEDRRDQQSFTF